MTDNTTNTDLTTRALALLTHPDAGVRLRAATEFGAAGNPATAEVLVDRLAVEQDAYVRETLTWAVVRHIDAVLPRVLALLASPDAPARRQAAHVLSKVGDPTLAPHLLGVVGDADPEVAVKGYRAAAATGRPEVVGALVARLGHGDIEQRDALSTALQRLGELGVPALIEALRDPDADVREHAADALGHLGHPAADPAAEALSGLLADESADVRLAAVGALSQLGGEAAEGPLASATASKDPMVASVANRVLASSPRPGA